MRRAITSWPTRRPPPRRRENALRSPACSSARSPRAVIPPGEVTARRTASVSMWCASSSAAEPASESATSSAACAAGMPCPTAASTHASAISATYAGATPLTAVAASISRSASRTTRADAGEQLLDRGAPRRRRCTSRRGAPRPPCSASRARRARRGRRPAIAATVTPPSSESTSGTRADLARDRLELRRLVREHEQVGARRAPRWRRAPRRRPRPRAPLARPEPPSVKSAGSPRPKRERARHVPSPGEANTITIEGYRRPPGARAPDRVRPG